MTPILIILFAIAMALGGISLMIVANRDRKFLREHWLNENDPARGIKIKRRHGETPYKGISCVVVNPDKWVVVKWNKKTGDLDVFTPPQSHLSPDPLMISSINMRIMSERQEVVTVEKYFKRQVM